MTSRRDLQGEGGVRHEKLNDVKTEGKGPLGAALAISGSSFIKREWGRGVQARTLGEGEGKGDRRGRGGWGSRPNSVGSCLSRWGP